MGPKGSNVQGITQEHNVSIKFPDRDPPPKPATNGDAPESPKEPEPRNIIRITGRLENAQAAKQALLVSGACCINKRYWRLGNFRR